MRFSICSSASSKVFLSLLGFLLSLPQHGYTQYSGESFIVEPTPALRLSEEDLTTVLLLDTDNGRNQVRGRLLNVRPEVGLLTSTARTFIQEGVTTEYATRLVGTTLENGRIYAQLLKKSSRVLYKPSVVTSWVGESAQTKSLLQSHNDLSNADHVDWKYIDDRLLLEKNAFVGNTDYVGFHDLRLQRSGNNTQRDNSSTSALPSTAPVLVSPVVGAASSPSSPQAAVNIAELNKPVEKVDPRKIAANKVTPFGDLPTYTVKNFFSPSRFSSETAITDATAFEKIDSIFRNRETLHKYGKRPDDTPRSPKLYHQKFIGNRDSQGGAAEAIQTDALRPQRKPQTASRQLSTITYYGFADFTTVVADSVIVFLPSTLSANPNSGHITSIKGEATLAATNARSTEVPITVTQTVIVPTYIEQQLSTMLLATATATASSENKSHFFPDTGTFLHIQPLTSAAEKPKHKETETKETVVQTLTTSLETISSSTTSVVQTETEVQAMHEEVVLPEEEVLLQASEQALDDMSTKFKAGQSLSSRDDSVAFSSKPVIFSRPSDEDILRIYASLASLEAAKQSSLSMPPVGALNTTAELEMKTPAELSRTAAEGPKTERVEKEAGVQSMQSSDYITVLGGATTVFYEDDPFENFIEPTETTAPTLLKRTESLTTDSQEIDLVASTNAVTKKNDFSEAEESESAVTTVSNDVTNEEPIGDQALPKAELMDPTTLPPTETTEEYHSTTAQLDNTTASTPQLNATTTAPIVSTHTHPQLKAAVVVQEIEADASVDLSSCIRTSQVFLTQLARTLTHLTTYLITDQHTAPKVSTSVQTNLVPTFDIGQATKHYCIQSSNDLNTRQTAQVQLDRPATEESDNDTMEALSPPVDIMDSKQEEEVSLPAQAPEHEEAIMSQGLPNSDKEHLNEEDDYKTGEDREEEEEATEEANAEEDGIEGGGGAEDDADVEDGNEDDDSGEEVDLIYKTLYTTYTYLTTFFHDDTTSISSHKEVVTNIITSTLGPESSDIKSTKLSELFKEDQIAPSSKFLVPSELESILGLDNAEESTANGQRHSATEADGGKVTGSQLDESQVKKTYFTTYTYYTTIFAEGETEVMSRTEVHTNYLAGTSTPTASLNTQEAPISIVVDTTASEKSNVVLGGTTPNVGVQINASTSSLPYKLNLLTTLEQKHAELGPVADLKDYLSKVTNITDVRSSSSNGDHNIISNNHAVGVPFEDQISSESNTDEIIPSATLLLQTSFTTFTYYTTMYSADSTNVVSRLETVTNVVTETLQPTKPVNVEEATLPITYFTTFTYWTKLSKDGEISTLSREETVSNVITPTSVPITDSTLTSVALPGANKMLLGFTDGNSIIEEEVAISSVANSQSNSLNALITLPFSVQGVQESALEPTSFYTTYTYYTTSYVNDDSITNSRFETVTNIVTPSKTLSLDMSSVPLASDESSLAGTNGLFNATVLLDISLESVISQENRKIIDAEGISTLYYTTQVIATTVEGGAPTEVTNSNSSLHINEEKKAFYATSKMEAADGSSTRQYKTGLVRLIEGTRIANHTTTLYQSKVIGTVIDNRYAQIIESTSSFLIEKTKAPQLERDDAIVATQTINPSPMQSTIQLNIESVNSYGDVVQSSSAPNVEHKAEEQEEQDGDKEGDNESQSGGDRASLQSKKHKFTPVIRPFASRSRPQFAPKKKNVSQSSATIITRSDFTPTITATPALKSSGRFSSSRRGAFANGGISLNSGLASGSPASRRFNRPNKASAGPNQPFGGSSVFPSASGAPRNRYTSSVIAPPGSRRISSPVRTLPSAGFRAGLSSVYTSNFRTRVRPTATSVNLGSQSTLTDGGVVSNSSEEDTSTTEISTDSEEDHTTENSRRSQNPLLRFRKPPLSRPSSLTSRQNKDAVSQRRNPLAARAKAATTSKTTTTTTTSRPRPRSFQRPAVSSINGRARPQSGLFAPRGLFQVQPQQPATNQDTDEGVDKKSNENEDFTDGGDIEDDSEYDDEEDDDDEDDEAEVDVNRRRRSNSKSAKIVIVSKNLYNKLEPAHESKVKPDSLNRHLHRTKREADTSQQTRNNFRNRFRRPKPTVVTGERSTVEKEIEPNTPTPSTTAATRLRFGTNTRFSARGYQSHNFHHTTSSTTTTDASTSNHRAIRPTRPTTGRAPFTLREKDTTPSTQKSLSRPGSGSIRRPKTASSARRSSTQSTNSRRTSLKSYASSNTATETSASRTSNARSRNSGGNLGTSTRMRSTTRGRVRNDYNAEPLLPIFDGTITVTYVVPTQITIPVINGKITEYKNVVTAKTSTEILGPQQYTTFIGTNGQSSTALKREDSTVNLAGATEVTQYVLHESATKTVIFTPTTIRGRKTSFSHVIPSTVYSVQNVISTAQPQINANAPLANILLSQLFLGNIGLPQNPLLGALGGAITQPAQQGQQLLSPVTEYRTHTSTYVTTVFEGTSTILPITFQGKKILTTIFDTTAQTITATEFLTDTIVTTATQQPAQAAQVNSLLLQQLLLQQQPLPLIQSKSVTTLPLWENLQDLQDTDSIRVSNDTNDIDDISTTAETHAHKSGRKKNRKAGKSNKRHKTSPAAEESSSVITIYVSGRRPGDFSTVLSTVSAGYDSPTQYKRHAAQYRSASIDTLDDFYAPDGSEIVSEFVLPHESLLPPPTSDPLDSSQKSNTIQIAPQLDRNVLDYSESNEQTTSLESVVGDVGLWHEKSTARYVQQLAISTSVEAPLPTANTQADASGAEKKYFLD